jgi:RNA methyltransferase, TrmH family
MTVPEAITSRSNPLIKSARSLKERKERNKSGQFLVEGILHVGEASAAGWVLKSIFYAPDLLASDYANNLIKVESEKGVRCITVSEEVLESLAEKENPQGIVAVVNQKTTDLASFSPDGFQFGLALVSPQDPGNVGTILRTLDAVGADGLFLLDGGVDPFHPSAVRASMGALFWKSITQCTFAEFISWSGKNGYRLIGTSAHGNLDYRALKLSHQSSILVLGSEQKGLSGEQLLACDFTVKLPMRGRASSLNLAVAAGILLYSLMEKR